MRPEVLLIFLTRFEESMVMLKGIAHYERTHQLWTAFHDDQARVETEQFWLRSKKWDGVISRHTTPALVEACAERRIPLVDLNDTKPFPGVPKIRPDNVALGHLGAEHFIERGYQNFGFSGFANDGWSCERRDGYLEALRLAGKKCEMFDVNYPGDLTPSWDVEQIASLCAWLKRLPKPVACDGLQRYAGATAHHGGPRLRYSRPGRCRHPRREQRSHPAANWLTPRCPASRPTRFNRATAPPKVLAGLLEGRPPAIFDQRIEPLGVVARLSTDALAIHDRNVAAALNFIRERACAGINVEEVSKHAFASRSQLEKKFRQFLGRSPQAEIRRVQVAKIRQLLTETDFPLKKIAELTGFEHVEYPRVLFKRLTGDSPGVYRKNTQIKDAQSAWSSGGQR